MQHDPASSDTLSLHGPISHEKLLEEVHILSSLKTETSVTLHFATDFLKSIPKAQWNAMADVFLDVGSGRQKRKMSWTKYLYQSIHDVRLGNIALHGLIIAIDCYKAAVQIRIAEITSFGEEDFDDLQILIDDIPRLQGYPLVECLQHAIMKLSLSDFDILARTENEHGFVFHEVNLALGKINVSMNRLRSNLRKASKENETAITYDTDATIHEAVRVRNLIMDVIKNNWAEIWNASARQYGLPGWQYLPIYTHGLPMPTNNVFTPEERSKFLNTF